MEYVIVGTICAAVYGSILWWRRIDRSQATRGATQVGPDRWRLDTDAGPAILTHLRDGSGKLPGDGRWHILTRFDGEAEDYWTTPSGSDAARQVREHAATVHARTAARQALGDG